MKVNSRHKKIIDNLACYNVAAVCEDGYPDVIEYPDKKFNLGVRFHPESLYKTDTYHNAIIKSFVDACRSK